MFYRKEKLTLKQHRISLVGEGGWLCESEAMKSILNGGNKYIVCKKPLNHANHIRKKKRNLCRRHQRNVSKIQLKSIKIQDWVMDFPHDIIFLYT